MTSQGGTEETTRDIPADPGEDGVMETNTNPERRVAHGRPETDPCQAGTPGCCIDHVGPGDEDMGCDTW